MEVDPEEGLKMIVLKSGEVSSVYGGFKIRVMNPPSFPWYQVNDQLIETGQEVWIKKTGGQLYVNFKPETMSSDSRPPVERYLLFYLSKLLILIYFINKYSIR